jgi:hypothetical protein|eukprot:COSAG06_NODE_5095_length_3722_cov_6.544852_1_plen_402_part_00
MVPLLLLLLSMMPAAAAANWTVLTISGRRHSPGVRTAGGATVTTNPLLVLRSGSPNTTSSATLSAVLAPGVTIDALGFSFSFEMGYGDGASAACGAQLNVTVAGKTAYASPMLSGYPYSRTKDPGLYSPPVVVMQGLAVQVTPSNQEVALVFHNLCRNVQLLLPININISCTGSCLAPAPPPPAPPQPAPPPPRPTGMRRNVFLPGEGGYSCFRIPAVLQLPTGGYAVFAEARNKSCSDWAPTDTVVKTSLDGLSWSNMTVLCPFVGEAGQRLCSNHDFDYKMSAHNPSPVIINGSTIFLAMENNCYGCKRDALYGVRGALQQHAGSTSGDIAEPPPRIVWEENATDITKVNGWPSGIHIGAAGNGVLLEKTGRAVLPVHSDHWGGGRGAAGSGAAYSDDG